MRIVCHVGVHKTATTYLQGRVFPAWRQEGFYYNPSPISNSIRLLFLLAEERERHIELFEACKQQILEELSIFERTHPQATLLLSYEKFSQFDFRQNYIGNARLLNELLPNAEILLFLRYQPDWLCSLYKQAIASGDYQDPFTLFDFHEGQFGRIEGPWGDDGLLKIDALRADWVALIDVYRSMFGEDSLKVFFYEDFTANPDAVCREIAGLLGLEVPISIDKKRVNKGVSIGLCQELDELARLLRSMGLSWLIHSSRKEYRRLLQKVAKKDSRLAYLLNVRPKLLTRSLDWMPKLVSGNSDGKRFQAQWATMRPLLDEYYRDRNSVLPDLLSGVEVPSKYIGAC
jgi:hypothetical protein